MSDKGTKTISSMILTRTITYQYRLSGDLLKRCYEPLEEEYICDTERVGTQNLNSKDWDFFLVEQVIPELEGVTEDNLCEVVTTVGFQYEEPNPDDDPVEKNGD